MFSRSLPTNLLASVVICGGIALAQTTTSPSLTVVSFTEESVINSDQLTSPDAPSLPDDLVSTVQAGLADLHQFLVYDSTRSTLTVRVTNHRLKAVAPVTGWKPYSGQRPAGWFPHQAGFKK